MIGTLRGIAVVGCLTALAPFLPWFPVWADEVAEESRTASPAEPLPPLAKAREFGRSRSSLLADSDDRVIPAGPPKADVAGFQKHVAPVFATVCVSCHGPETSEGGLRVDTLDPDLLSGADVERWVDVFGAVSNGEMPPGEKSEHGLTDDARAKVIEWLGREIQKASVTRRDGGKHTSFRRMTKYEYNYALQDLLGLPYDFAAKLPPDPTSEDGFENSSAMLQMSAVQFETYRSIGLEALRKAVVIGEGPKPIDYVVSMDDQLAKAAGNKKVKFFDRESEKFDGLIRRQHLFDVEAGRGIHTNGVNWNFKPVDDAAEGPAESASSVVLVLGANDSLRLNLGNHLPDDGIMRVRVRAGRTTNEPGEHVALRLDFGAHTSNNANFTETISQSDLPVTASADAPEFVQFEIPLSEIPRNPFRKNVETFPRRDELLTIKTVSNTGNVRVHVDRIDISAPYYEQWPPRTHEAIFFPSEHRKDEQRYGREVLTRFMERAWARPVEASEVEPFLNLFETYRPEFETFEGAMLEVLATVLATPEFLYLTVRDRDKESIGDVEWANRIAFFLWSSLPDDELLKVAREGRLGEPDVLNAQIERMLADPRAERFSRHFVEQWLGLDGMESVAHIGDAELKKAMRQEPIAFFDEVLGRDDSVMDFLHADYVVINEKLARHYRIPEVRGPEFRRVPVDPNRHRGGLLTTAAILSMNSDGKDSHPLKRSIWLLEHVLNDPPPPPPPDVPEVDLTDPRILEMTLKERIADHRNKPACLSCHSKIDPWGIAFENYDALGTYRTTIGKKPVDSKSVLFNDQPLDGMDGLKRFLLTNRQDQFARALVHKMTAYALGRPLSFGDRADVDELTRQFRRRGDRLGDLVTLIIRSDLFRAGKGSGT